MQELQAMMKQHFSSVSGWRAAALGIVIGLCGFFVANMFLSGISPSRIVVMGVGLLGIGVSVGLTLLWSTVPLDRANYRKSGVLRGLMGMAGGVGVGAWAAGLNWLIWIAGAATLVLMRAANVRLNR